LSSWPPNATRFDPMRRGGNNEANQELREAVRATARALWRPRRTAHGRRAALELQALGAGENREEQVSHHAKKLWAKERVVEMERRRRSRQRPSFGRWWISLGAARTGRGEGAGDSRGVQSGQLQGSRWAFIGQGGVDSHGREQWPLTAMAVAGFKTFKRRGLDGGVTVGN
jgi:hypothetical protein